MFTFITELFLNKDNHPLIRLAETEYGPDFRRLQKSLGRRPTVSEVEYLFTSN